jgi:uncharacterized membrane protein
VTETPLLVYALALVPAVLWGFGPIFDKRGMDAGGNFLQAALVVGVDVTLDWIALVVRNLPAPFAGLTPRLGRPVDRR